MKYANLEIYYLQSVKSQIIMLELKPYYNKIRIFDLEAGKKIHESKIQHSIAVFYKECGIYKHLTADNAKNQLKKSGLADYLPTVQTAFFNQNTLSL